MAKVTATSRDNWPAALRPQIRPGKPNPASCAPQDAGQHTAPSGFWARLGSPVTSGLIRTPCRPKRTSQSYSRITAQHAPRTAATVNRLHLRKPPRKTRRARRPPHAVTGSSSRTREGVFRDHWQWTPRGGPGSGQAEGLLPAKVPARHHQPEHVCAEDRGCSAPHPCPCTWPAGRRGVEQCSALRILASHWPRGWARGEDRARPSDRLNGPNGNPPAERSPRAR